MILVALMVTIIKLVDHSIHFHLGMTGNELGKGFILCHHMEWLNIYDSVVS